MSPRQHKDFLEQLATRRKSGETVNRSRKKRSDAGVPRKRKAAKENSGTSKRTKTGHSQAINSTSRAIVDGDDSGGNQDGNT